jgi:hypothetical protein
MHSLESAPTHCYRPHQGQLTVHLDRSILARRTIEQKFANAVHKRLALCEEHGGRRTHAVRPDCCESEDCYVGFVIRCSSQRHERAVAGTYVDG